MCRQTYRLFSGKRTHNGIVLILFVPLNNILKGRKLMTMGGECHYVFDLITSIYKAFEFLSFTYLLNNDDVRPKFEN